MRVFSLIWNGVLFSASPRCFVINLLGRSPCLACDVALWSVDFLASPTSPFSTNPTIWSSLYWTLWYHPRLFTSLSLWYTFICDSVCFVLQVGHLVFLRDRTFHFPWFIPYLRSDNVFRVLCIQAISLSEGPFSFCMHLVVKIASSSFFLRSDIPKNIFSQVFLRSDIPIWVFSRDKPWVAGSLKVLSRESLILDTSVPTWKSVKETCAEEGILEPKSWAFRMKGHEKKRVKQWHKLLEVSKPDKNDGSAKRATAAVEAKKTTILRLCFKIVVSYTILNSTTISCALLAGKDIKAKKTIRFDHSPSQPIQPASAAPSPNINLPRLSTRAALIQAGHACCSL